jgi:RNA polymerase sigma-70 factor (ECF subfamily)
MHGTSPAMTLALVDDTSDAALAARAANGDEAAFEGIMRRHNRLLFRTARSILHSDAEAEDALQDAYLSAWRALGSFRSEARLSTWLVRIVINEALGRLRRRSAQVLAFDPSIDLSDITMEDVMEGNPDDRPDRAAMRSEMRARMEACIDMLPEAFRTVFMLRAVEEMNVEEVSAALGLPEATVRTRYFRARGLLRESLARDVDQALADAFSFDGARCDRIVAGVMAQLGTPNMD